MKVGYIIPKDEYDHMVTKCAEMEHEIQELREKLGNPERNEGPMKVSKKLACELANKILGTQKMIRYNNGLYYFGAGETILTIQDRFTVASHSIFEYFFLDVGVWYGGPAVCCTLLTGKYLSVELYFTEMMEEIRYAWKSEEEV